MLDARPVDVTSAMAERLRGRYFLYYLRRNHAFGVGLAIAALLLFCAAFPSVLATHSATDANPTEILQPPSSTHFLGTDSNGMDIYSRIVWAPRVDVVVAVTSVVFALLLGVPAGAALGYMSGRKGLGGWIENWVMRGFDVLQAFPVFVLGLAIMAVLGRQVINIIAVLVFLYLPILMRLTRSTVLSVRARPFVEAARCAGNSELRIVGRHILPNSLGPALINASVLTGAAMIITAGLSFVGAGVPAPTPEWGFMVAIGAPNMITGQWWPALFPGLALGLAVLAFALIGDGLRTFLDPARRS